MTDTPRRLQAELVLDAHAELGEGPAWDPEAGWLTWVDIKRSRVRFFDPERAADWAVEVGQHVGAATRRARGGWLLAVRDGFATLDADGTVSLVAPVEAERGGNRMNDGKCDPRGRFWAGTMADDETPGAGSLYRLDPDGTVTTMLTGVPISNGLAWSADERTMYYVDSPTGGVDAFDFDPDAGTIANRRRAATVPAGAGAPDGMTIDHDGCLWVAMWGGSAVHRYTPDGSLDTVVSLPTSQVTCCAFGGGGGDELFITTGRLGLSDQQLGAQPQAGGLFRCRPGTSGPASVPAAY
jgi:sugar lactone lactonase YvrE